MKKKITTVLALDQATYTGYAIYKNREIIKSGVTRLNILSREEELYDFLETTCKRYNVTDIVAEDIYKGRESAYNVLAGLKSIINLYQQRHKEVILTYQQAEMMQRFILEHRLYSRDYKNELLKAKNNPYKLKKLQDEHRAMIKSATKKRIENLGYTLTSDRDDESDAIGHLLLYIKKNELPLELPTGEMYS